MMSDALLRLGHADVVREYAEWFAPHQFANGKVPCCVDGRGSDPVPENDSHGELIHLIAQILSLHAATARWLQRCGRMSHAAAAYMDSLRATGAHARRTRAEERRAFYGLMPPSISHEGYSDRPAYSYWDDFWALAGYDERGRDRQRARTSRRRGATHRARATSSAAISHASMRASIAQHGIDYIPGSADRGDFDATSTTIALSIAGQQSDPAAACSCDETFERYWRDFLARRDGAADWNDYTPYELRTVGAFVRLGWRERARQSARFLPARTAAPRGGTSGPKWSAATCAQPRFLGDMPHALGRIGFHPVGARPVRLRARAGPGAGAGRRHPDCNGWTATASRSRICARPTES